MSIVTKGARKGLSIATVIGLAAGLLTGVVAPASAADTMKSTASAGLRATKTYANTEVLAHVTLSTANNDGFVVVDTIEGTGYCTKDGKVKNGAAWDTKLECEGMGGTWTQTTSFGTYGPAGNGIYVDVTPDTGLTSLDFQLSNITQTDAQTVDADLTFVASNDFAKSGTYKFIIKSVGGVTTTVTLFIGGAVKTAVFTPEYNPAPAGESMKWTLKLTDEAGNATSLLDAELLTISYTKSGSTLLEYVLDGVAGSVIAPALDTELGAYVFAGVGIPDAGTYNFTAMVDATADVTSNTVTLVTVDVAEDGDLAVVEKAGVVEEAAHTATVRTDVRAVDYTWTSDNGADDAGLFVKFAVDNLTDIDEDDLTAVTVDKWVRLDASGVAKVTVTDAETSIDTGDSYRVKAQGDNVVATYRPAGFNPSIDLVSADGWAVADITGHMGNNEYAKSITPGSTLTAKLQVADVFGTAVKGAVVYAYGPYDDGAWKPFDDSELTDANGQVTFSMVNNNEAADLATVRELVSHFDFDLPSWNFDEEIVSGDQTDLTLDAAIVRSVAPSELNAKAEGATAAVYNAAGHELAIDTADATADDNVDLQFDVVNSDGISLWGVPVTVSTTAGGYVGTDVNSISKLTAGSKVYSSAGLLHAFATSTKTGAATFTVAAGSLSAAFTTTYTNAISDARYIAASEATAAVVSGQFKTLTYTVTDRFGNAVSDVAVNVTELGAGRLAYNGTSTIDLTTGAAGTVSVDVVSGVDEVGTSTVTATIVKPASPAFNQARDKAGKVATGAATSVSVTGVTAGVSAAATAVTYALPVAPAASVKIGVLKGKIVVKALNAADHAVAIFVGGKLVTSFVASSNYVVKHIKAAKGKKSVVVKIYGAPTITVKKTVTVK